VPLQKAGSTVGMNDAPIRIANLSSDFRSGVVLIRLLEIVTKVEIRDVFVESNFNLLFSFNKLRVGAYEKEPKILWHFIVVSS